MIKLIECPRDAMQGLKEFIPTETKAAYINQLLKAGFHTIDFGSFVSPKAIPQMRDTAAVLEQLDLSNTNSKLLAIVANRRGANDAIQFEEIDFLGYPFSISETFQLRNTNATIEESLHRVEQIQEICVQHNKHMLVYISMGFGNPYGDDWNVEIVQKWVDVLANMGIRYVQLSDTIGVSNPASIRYLFSNLMPHYEEVEIGAHLHTEPHNWEEKIAAAYESGCRRFDGAIKGFGGCPMAKSDLTGNMPTENMFYYFEKIGATTGVDKAEFQEDAHGFGGVSAWVIVEHLALECKENTTKYGQLQPTGFQQKISRHRQIKTNNKPLRTNAVQNPSCQKHAMPHPKLHAKSSQQLATKPNISAPKKRRNSIQQDTQNFHRQPRPCPPKKRESHINQSGYEQSICPQFTFCLRRIVS